jgi:hypothetical protein
VTGAVSYSFQYRKLGTTRWKTKATTVTAVEAKEPVTEYLLRISGRNRLRERDKSVFSHPGIHHRALGIVRDLRDE